MPVDGSHRTARNRMLVALLAATLVTAACGSTVAVPQQAAPGDVGATAGPVFDDGLAVGETDVFDPATANGPDGGAAGGTSAGAAAPSGAAGAAGAAGTTSGAADGTGEAPGTTAQNDPSGAGSGGAGQQQARTGRGITDDKIAIGVIQWQNVGAANQSVGEDSSQGDPNLYRNAMIRQINRAGGIAGREIVPVEYELDETTTQTQSEIEQQMCETWTNDNEVFAAISDLASDVLKTCMVKAGSVLIGPSLSRSDTTTFQRFPHYFEVAAMRLDRIARVYPRSLAADGFFSDDAKVGVLTYDTPDYARATDKVLLPELARLGFDDVEVRRVPFAIMPSELGGSSAGISSAVLRFRQQGVTHVLFLEFGGTLAFLWFPQAESQGYRPRYGMNSQSALAAQDAPQQLRNALGVSWIPFGDMGVGRRTQEPPGFGACMKVMRAAGARFSSGNPSAHRSAGSTCDAFRLLQSGLDAAGRDLTPDGFARGVQAVGGRFATAHGYGVDLRSRRDGASVVRPIAFRTACECWRYNGPARPAS